MRTIPIVFRINSREKDLLASMAKEQGKSLSQTIRDLLELSLQDAAILREIEELKGVLTLASNSPLSFQPGLTEIAPRLATLEQGLLRVNIAIDELTKMICKTEETYRHYQCNIADKLQQLNTQHKEP